MTNSLRTLQMNQIFQIVAPRFRGSQTRWHTIWLWATYLQRSRSNTWERRGTRWFSARPSGDLYMSQGRSRAYVHRDPYRSYWAYRWSPRHCIYDYHKCHIWFAWTRARLGIEAWASHRPPRLWKSQVRWDLLLHQVCISLSYSWGKAESLSV